MKNSAHVPEQADLLPCRNVVILSTADFRSPVWTNKQHMAVGLAKAGFTVFYIESLGLRAPTFSRADVARILRRAGKVVRRFILKQRDEVPLETIPTNLSIIAPSVLPFHGSPVVRRINTALISRLRRQHLPDNGDFTLWTFSPLTYGLECGAGGVVYHSVDLLHSIPGVPADALREAERALLGKSDLVIASSKGVLRHLEASGRKEVLLWENVAETDLFSSHMGTRLPRAIFAGNVTPTKIDIQLLQDLVRAGVGLAIAGPIGIDGSSTDSALKELVHSPGVDYLGNLSLPELATEVGKSQVGLIPYLNNGYTQGVFPMKVYEYLAGGVAVVSTDIPSLIGQSIPGLDVVPREDFVRAVRRSLESFTEDSAQQRSIQAKANSWENRIKDASAILHMLESAR